MYIWRFYVEGGSVPDWLQVIGAAVLIGLTIKYGKNAIDTLDHMKGDTEQTLRMFKAENRPYLAVLPEIRLSEDIVPITEKGVTKNHTFTGIAYSLKNHGRLPCTVKSIRVALTDSDGNVKIELEEGDGDQIVVFPDVERTMATHGIDVMKNYLVDIGSSYGLLYFVRFWIEYYSKEPSADTYIYESHRRIRTDVKDDSAVLTEMYR